MYMRLPWIVGNAGLYLVVGIILAAHVISVTTGLSVSSIATDKRVEAGGAYYIVSRTMGLAMGGTLGLALFTGLSFSISLYLIGFSESFLDFFGFPKTLDAIRLCGTISLVLLTIVTFISTSLAIRAQYLILALIVGSLASIFLGSPEVPAAPMLVPAPGAEPATVLFGIFFPAVTGFTAGVNMSGDLRDPRKSIPIGTVLSIATGLVVYLALAVFFAYRVNPELLRSDGAVLLKIAWSPSLVVGGIWGATISSALGSILGAPRILQALSLDHVTPRIFGVGHGPSQEPRYALILACIIGEVGILIGELDAIARVVSVFFIATYGFLNLSATFEMWASPDFRPDFRIPRIIPVIGVFTCAILMIWLDLVAMFGAVVLMAVLFVVLKRRELQLETGDAWLGVWSSVVRNGLERLATDSLHQRNWRPNILVFTHPEGSAREPLLEFGRDVIRHRGVATELQFPSASGEVAPPPEHDPIVAQQGFFRKILPPSSGAPAAKYPTMTAVCHHHGFAGLDPNTVMLDWHEHASRPADLAAFVEDVVGLDYNVVCLAFDRDRGFGRYQEIDLWRTARAGSLALQVALSRYLTSAEEWRRAKLRFLALTDDSTIVDTLHRGAVETLASARVDGRVKVVDNGAERRSHADRIAESSASVDLVVIGLPHDRITANDIVELDKLVSRLGAVLLVRASSQFSSGFGVTGASTLPREITEEVRLRADIALPALRVSEAPDIAELSRWFAREHLRVITAFRDRALRPGIEAREALVQALRDVVEEQYALLATTQAAGARRRERSFTRAPDAVLGRALDAVVSLGTEAGQRDLASAQAAVEELLTATAELARISPRRLVVARDRSDFRAVEGDRRTLRLYKAWS
ncbi:MAG: hypothetical protein KC621_34030, partial [Myxococcales bacterium]|nr:hypothetical protein [Myxococcales bacterium]